ncbi:hypothetical protein M9H77_05167 [Catharanthus roseus]|uniref:Uncharacterized protein n=1 Tax=Catharanthus roseus TaxID=4058 RepID=A0ACC0CGL1_CATRO|nr:hypothetical protein M9H77_05167 [Catharanthus roseus]
MGFWSLLEVASMPILQVLIISILGAFLATDKVGLFPADARRSLNKIVFMVFTPCLMFASLAKTVTLEDIISWWFMPVNIGITFLVGGVLGWIAVKLVKPRPHLEGLVVATCASGNLGNLLLIIVPAMCDEDGSPFGDLNVCSSRALSYASFSMALGGFYIWTISYQLVRSSATRYKAMKIAEEEEKGSKEPNKNLDSDEKSRLLEAGITENVSLVVSTEDDAGSQIIGFQGSKKEEHASFLSNLGGILHQILEELMAPPTLAAIIGFIFGAISWLRNIVIGENAPLRVIQESVKLLGDGTIPCITLILGGNLTQGLRKATVKIQVVLAVLCVRYILMPICGIGVVKAAAHFGFLPPDPLYHFVLLIQFALPPAMNISTMTQLFDVAQDECSVLFLWTYVVAVFSLTIWSTIFLWII